MAEVRKTLLFARWLEALDGVRARACILVRIERLVAGNAGDTKAVGEGVAEQESGRHVRGPVICELYEGRRKDRFYLYCRQNGLWPLEVGGRDPAKEPSYLAPYCPVRNVTADTRPP